MSLGCYIHTQESDMLLNELPAYSKVSTRTSPASQVHSAAGRRRMRIRVSAASAYFGSSLAFLAP